MKNLLIALICVFSGASAYATKVTPDKPSTTTTVVLGTKKSNQITVSQQENKNIELFRRQMCFTFTDLCGQVMQVWVSGPHSASNFDLWQTALDYAHSPGQMSYGCFK